MKAHCDLEMAAKHQLRQKILKSKTTQEQMQDLLVKLKNIVPNMPRNRKLSKLEIIQYVIDYIMDLQFALETHPAATARPSVGLHTRPGVTTTLLSSNRQPLGVISSPALNTCAAQEVIQAIQAEKLEVISNNRPVSC